MFLKFKQDCGEYKATEVVEMDDVSAGTMCKMGVADAVENPVADASAKIEKALADRDANIISIVTKALHSEVKVPAQPKEDDTSFGDFLIQIGNTSANRPNYAKEKAYNKLREAYKVGPATMSEGADGDGGYTVPVDYVKELLYVPGYDGAIFPDRIKVRPMGTKSLVLPALDQTITPANGSSAFYGGVNIGIVAEGEAPSDNTQPKFKQVVLTAKKCLATTAISTELLEDSIISVESLLRDLLSNAANWFLNWQIFNGGNGTDSANALTGFLGHASCLDIPRFSYGEVTLEDIGTMYAVLSPQSRKNAVWFMNPLVFQQLIMLGSNGGAASHFVWIGNDAQGKPSTKLLGLDMVPTEALPMLGNAGDIVLADPRFYALGIRSEMKIDSSPHYLYGADQILYRLRMRVDGKPQLTAPLKLADGTTMVSPFVKLGDAAGGHGSSGSGS